jgi:catalase-peroxidase
MTDPNPKASAGECPMGHGKTKPSNKSWWPDALDVLGRCIAIRTLSDPMGQGFDYAAAFKSASISHAVIQDLARADDRFAGLVAGRLRPLRRRCSSAWPGTAPAPIAPPTAAAARAAGSSASRRSIPGRTTPISTRRAACCGRSSRNTASLSWADLMILAGNVALESMGFKTFGFAGGRADVWEPEGALLGPGRRVAGTTSATAATASSTQPLGAVQMGLIYVNPEGPNGNPDPVAAARDIRETFARMAMDDEETVALIAGGHTFGKTHGAGDPARRLSGRAGRRPIEDQGLGWKSSAIVGNGADTITSGIEGDLDAESDALEQPLLHQPVQVRVGADEEPGRRQAVAGEECRCRPTDCRMPMTRRKRHAPMMLTTDLALRLRSRPTRRSRAASSRTRTSSPMPSPSAWFKLTHRDMGPHAPRYLGPLVPAEAG